MNFEKDVIEKSKISPVVVEFYADWCGPCKVLKPIVASVTNNKEGIDLVLVDVDKNQDISQKYQIRSIPSVFLFVDGKPLSRYPGQPIQALFDKWLTSMLED